MGILFATVASSNGRRYFSFYLERKHLSSLQREIYQNKEDKCCKIGKAGAITNISYSSIESGAESGASEPNPIGRINGVKHIFCPY